MNGKIAIIAPYAGLKQEADEVIAEMGQRIAVYEGDLAEGVEAARQAIMEGAEVIISRGGTARLISQLLDVPVVEIKVSLIDILRSLAQLRDYHGAVGISGWNRLSGRSCIPKVLLPKQD